jgi:transcriptional regulator NrdR family protein
VKCPNCGTFESRVKKTIIQVEELGFSFGELKQRRRECLSCGRCFFSYEIHEDLFRKIQALAGREPKSLKESKGAKPPARRQLLTPPNRGPLEFRSSLDDE